MHHVSKVPSLSGGNFHTIISTFHYVQMKGDKVARKVTKTPCGELAKWSR